MAKRGPMKTLPVKIRKKPRLQKALLTKSTKPQIILKTNRNVKSKNKSSKGADQVQAPLSADISHAVSQSSPQSTSVPAKKSRAKIELSKKKGTSNVQTETGKDMKQIKEINSNMNKNKDKSTGNKDKKAKHNRKQVGKTGVVADIKVLKTAGKEKSGTKHEELTHTQDKRKETVDPKNIKAAKLKSAEILSGINKKVMNLASKGIKRGRSLESRNRPGSVKKRKDDVLNQTLTEESKIAAVSPSADVSKTSNVQTDKVKKTLPSPKPKENKHVAAESTTKVSKQQMISVSLSVKKTSKVSLVSPNKKKKEQLKLSVANLIGLKKMDHNKDILHNEKPNDASKKSRNKIPKASKVRKDSPDKVNVSITTENEDSDDDDDILYSLSDLELAHSIENNIDSLAPVKRDLDTSAKKLKTKKVEQEEKKAKKSKSASATDLVSKSSKSKKIRLLDSLKQTTSNKPVRPVSPTLLYTTVKHTGPLTTGIPTSSQPSQSHLNWTSPQEGNVHPNTDCQASLPISPASMSYKVLLENLPHQLHPKKSKRNGEEDLEDVERRLSVRATECAFKYKEILIKKCNRYTQIWLNTHTKMKNALNPQVIQEIISALGAAKYDDSNLVMFSGLDNVFCSGIDLHYLTSGDKKSAARKMSEALRDLVKKFITFPKLLVAVVTGPAIGLGCALLPLCDIVYASDKASFYMPYAELSQTPEGCASFTLPNCVGVAMANELLIGGRKITAIEACQLGLVSQVYWPTSMMQEVIPRVQHMALLSGKVLETTKLLMRSQQRSKLEHTNESECNLLLDRWPSPDCQRAIEKFLSNERNSSI